MTRSYHIEIDDVLGGNYSGTFASVAAMQAFIDRLKAERLDAINGQQVRVWIVGDRVACIGKPTMVSTIGADMARAA